MIPRVVHQVWFQGADQMPPKYAANMQELRRLNPGWRHRVWADADLRAAAAALGVGRAYDAATLMHQKIDLGRLCLLYLHGGITVDLDVRALKPLDTLPGLQSIDRLAVSLIPTNSAESAVMSMGCPRIPGSGQMCSIANNACLLAPPQDPALMHVIRHCAARLLRPPASWGKEALVNSTTGPGALTQAITTLPSAGMVTILPHTFFEPCIGSDPYCRLPAEAILDHRHDNTWISPRLKALIPLWYHLKRHWPLLLAAALAVWALRK